MISKIAQPAEPILANSLVKKKASSVRTVRTALTLLAAMQTYASADISGNVFIDGNNNGVKDVSEVGYPFMPVRAYAANAVTPTAGAVTDASGNYTITGLSAGPHRVEFLTPSGYSNGSFGSGSSTSIQFHNDGAAAANFGLYLAGQCGTDPDPRLIGTCGLIGSSAGISVVSWLYASESFPQPHSAPNNYNGVTHPHANDISSVAVGVPWAMSRLPGTQLVAMSPISSPLAFFGTGGASGTTALYIADYSGANKSFVSSKPLVQLSSLGYTLAPEHPISAGALTRFGEYGLGGLDASSDGNFLYVANLGRGNLLKIDISGVNYASLPATAPGAAQVTEIALPTTYAGFVSGTDGFFRATCVKEYAGSLYVAGTFDGSLRADNSAVRIVVLKMNFSTNAFTEAFSFDPTTFVVGNFVSSSTPQSRWLSTNGGGGFDQPGGPLQPVVSDIAFDDYGALNFGITDRTVYHDGSSNQVGYTISTWRQADGSFVLESQKMRGPLTKSPTGGQFDSAGASGPGGMGMFYDNSCYHPYLYSGGLLNMQGKDSIIGGWADALDLNAFGVRYNKPSSGEIFGGIHLGGGKQFAIVGVDAVCVPGPLEVGNYVWSDTNGNGMQDAGEPPLVGITVELVNASNSVIGTATTNSLGYFVFSADASRSDGNGADYGITALTTETAFTIRIPNISGGSQQSGLTGLYLTLGNTGANDLIDSDGAVAGSSAAIAITTGTEGQNNHSYDFGFSSTPPPDPCTITSINVTPGACNNNGTPNDSTDDYYTASVTVNYSNPPATGNLVLSGPALHSSNAVTTVAVGSLNSSTSHTFTGVRLVANSSTPNLVATFQ